MKFLFTMLFSVMFTVILVAQKTGCISGNCENGSGTYVYANGFRFEGDFVNGKREGRGFLKDPDGGTYDGMWSNDFFNGQGTKYTGEWKDGIQDGYGIYFYANGDKYTGYFKNNKFNGKGTYTWTNGQSATGTFRDGEMVSTE